jgi:hypothetical protein
LTGTNFASSAKVFFNGAQNGITVSAPTSSCALPTCLTATLPAALLGPYGSTNDITVLNTPPGGGQSKPVAFKVAAPPPSNDNFANALNIKTLTFNDVQDSSGATTETSDPTPPCVQQFTSSQGNTGGQLNGRYNTIWYKFTPVFSANLSVDTTNSNYDTVLSIWTGSAGSLVNIACNDDIIPGIIIQSQLLNVPLTAGTTYYIMVSSFGPPDPNPIALGGSSQFHFSYNNGMFPAAQITSLSPASAKSGDPGFTVTVNGSSFFNNAMVDFYEPNGTGDNFLATTFVSSTQLTAVVPASLIVLPSNFNVYVYNPAPTLPSNFINFPVAVGIYPVPTLNSISPNSAVAGYPASISIFATGSNFASSAVLNFNGVAEPTSIYSRGTLNATIPASALASAGTVQVTVSNPSPGGGPSSSLPFTIAVPNPVPTIASLSPASAATNTAPTVTVTGTGFVNGSEVFFNGNFYGVQFIGSTQLSVSLALFNFTPGTYSFYVYDPAPGGTSAPFKRNFRNCPKRLLVAGRLVLLSAGCCHNDNHLHLDSQHACVRQWHCFSHGDYHG